MAVRAHARLDAAIAVGRRPAVPALARGEDIRAEAECPERFRAAEVRGGHHGGAAHAAAYPRGSCSGLFGSGRLGAPEGA